MKRLDEIEAALIEAARRARTPTPEMRERVRGRALSAIAAGAVVPNVDAGMLERLSGAAGDAFESLAEGPTQARVLLGVAALSAVGVGGYGLGFDAGQARAVSTPAAPPASSALPVKLDAPSPPVPSSSPATPAAEVVAPTSASRSSRGRASGSAQTAVPSPPPLDPSEELRALRRIERAQREQNPRLALALLSELDRSVPQGKLQEEREASRTVASCELDDAASVARARAAEFTARFPNSVYAARVQQACGARGEGERNAPPLETDQNK